ncbi:MAG: valine--tRNA ligase [Alphaproteobacteria bacterium]|nr:valine--tRNA ligase [Alphaproteobacteria bacterium]NCQ87954.1 valine--tRNA ligase [Alphaproteobacteria bacterium]NCT05539.1 valine--tRNA ligase [Alphaproteobacteria bacterium]
MLDKTFNPSDIEERHYKQWEESGHFKCDPSSKAEPFTIMMPPPNVTGSLHMGHALNCTLHDILVRWNRMRGKDTLWQPGLDHAGIATQMVVERQLGEQGKDRRDMGRDEFIKTVWEWKEKSGGTIVGQQKRLGTTPDWERERFTMDEGLSKAVTKVFVQLHKEGLIYRDKRLVNWDPKFQTSISDLEVEHKDINGSMYHVQYPLEQGGGHIQIATTRPETILADGAIAVHPDDERYKDLIGKFAVVPICDRIIPIIADEYVDPEFGSGAVKITAAHDYNDFEVAKRHPDKNIQLINLMTPDGKMNENCPEDYVGLDRFEARKKIIKDLDELDYLVKVEKHKHQVPYGDRSGVVIEPYLTDQWYVDAKTMAIPAIEAVKTGKTEFIPKNWENTYFSWMDNIQPWCISRQLWWGHQIPAWYDEEGNIFVAESEEEAQKQAGKGKKLTRDEDVLDTWFSSALWPFSTLGWPDKTPELDKYYPGDTLITGFDIIFFWVARMMMMGMHFMGDVPFKKVYIHALVRDGKGQKMSKSKGNVIDPLDLIEKYGADSLRFTLTAMAAQGRDVRLSEERVAGYRNFTTKIWNAARYCEMNDCLPKNGFNPSNITHTLDKWIISEVKQCQTGLDKAIEAYRFNDAANVAYQFVWGTFCDWYLEFTKPVLNGSDETIKAEVQATTGWVLEQILRLLNPIMPYVTEELYADIAKREKGDLLLGSDWPDYSALSTDKAAVQKVDWLIRLISEIRSVRADMNVPPKAEIKLMVKDACDMTKEGINSFGEVIQKMARLESIEFTDNAPKGSIQTVIGQTTLILPIADIIDLDQERIRLKKEIDKLNDNIKKISQQLDNADFVANAPEEVIEEKREIVQNDNEKKEKLLSALKQLEAA